MPAPALSRRPGLLMAVATAASNVLAYGLSVVVSHRLGPDGFGEVAPLLAVVLVASVPGQALQAGVARRSARHADAEADAEASGVVAAGTMVGAAVLVVLLAVVPLLRSLLQLSGVAAPVWTALSLLPQTLCFASLGLMQGRARFGRLAVALILVQAGRLSGGVLGVLVADSAAGVMAGTAAGVLVAAVACCALAGVRAERPARGWRQAVQGLTSNTAAVLSILVLTNLDVLLARNRLDARAAGTYAAGALLAKMAFFGPSFLALLLFPRLARPDERRRALRTGALALAGSATVAVGATALGRGALPLLLGGGYRSLEHLAWLFAAAGSTLAAVHLLVQAGLAVGDHRLSRVAWGAVGTEALVVLVFVDSVTELVCVVLGLAVAVLLVGICLETGPRAQQCDDEPGWP